MALRQRHVHGVDCLIGAWAGRSIDTPLPLLMAGTKARPLPLQGVSCTITRTDPTKGSRLLVALAGPGRDENRSRRRAQGPRRGDAEIGSHLDQVQQVPR